jgi:superfamily II DNA or RNA helicase
MSETPHQVVISDLPSAGSTERAAIHLAALEWSILAPIIIRNQEDVKSRVRWGADLKPFVHQYENLYTFCRRLPVSLIADDVGLGKTVSAGLILSELMMRQRVRRTLVLCPKILCPQWESELKTKFGIEAHACSGTNSLKAAIRADHPVVITTNHSALAVLPTLANDQFEMLILDEAHKLRNLHGTNTPPQIAVRVREAIKKRLFSFVLMLTATPLHNRLWDIYSLIDLLSLGRNHANPFGDPAQFKMRFIDSSHPGDRVLQKGRKEEFRGIVRDYMVRTRRLDARLPFPTRIVKTQPLPLTPDESKLFEVVGQVIGQLTGLEQASLAKALLSSPQALAAQLRNMASTRPHFAKVSEAVSAFAAKDPITAKLSYLSALVSNLAKEEGDRWRLLVFTERAETQKALGRWLDSRGIKHGFVSGGQTSANQAAIAGLQADPPKLNCLVSTDAGAEGVNLQACNYVVNFDLPWNPMLVEQRIGRVQRLSSKHQHVVVTNLVLDHPADAHIVGLLMQKLMAISNAVDDIESVLEDVSPGEGSDGDSFATRIRTLVVKALQKQDTRAATEQIQKNIEEAAAKKLAQDKEIDNVFGPSEAGAHPDLRPPDLSYPDPSLSVKDFVLGAKSIDGQITAKDAHTFIHKPDSGLPEQFTFDKHAADLSHGTFGRRLEHYDAGTPPFQRLVGRWATEHHAVQDRTLSTREALFEAIQSLLLDSPWLVVTSAEVTERTNSTEASVVIRAQASNGVDRYEKLIPLGTASVAPDGRFPVKTTRLQKDDLPAHLPADIAAAVREDADIRSFIDYYEMKRQREKELAGSDAARLSRIAANYTNRLTTKVVAAEGVQHARLTVRVRYTIEGRGDYSSEYGLDTRAWQFTHRPKGATCAISGHLVPIDAVAQCVVTNTVACKHLLAQSGVSHRYVVTEQARICEASGTTLLPDEAGISDYSKRTFDRRILRASALSDRKGIADEFIHCDFSGTDVLLDEIVTSSISGKPIRNDAAVDLGGGRFAHRSELSLCQATGAWLPPADLGRSDFSGALVDKTLLIPSSLPPHRVGLESEMVICSLSGEKVLQDEVVLSTVSGKPCLPTLAAHSDNSGRVALPDEMVTCSLTGRSLLPCEVVRSDISDALIEIGREARSAISGRIGTPGESSHCEITGDVVLNDELLLSDVSAKRFRRDQTTTLADGRTCHVTEARHCEITGELLPLDDGAPSSVSGTWVKRDLLVPSEKNPHRYGLQSEVVVCSATGRRLLMDEVTTVASGQVADSQMVEHSELSGAEALPHELTSCEHSGKRALPSELEHCVVTGKRVDPSLLVDSPVSGRRALPSSLVPCTITEALVLPDELLESEVSKRSFRKDQSVTLADGRIVHVTEGRPCDVSGVLLSLDQGSTPASGDQWVNKKLLSPSEKSGRLGLQSELRRCSETNRLLLNDELAHSSTGAVGDKDLLTTSDLSGKPAFPSELVVCASSGKHGLPDEMGISAVTGQLVDQRLLRRSPVSGRLGAPDDFAKCEFTATSVLNDELATSELSGRRYRRDEQETDSEGKTGHASEFARCSRTKRLLPRTKMKPSDVSGMYVDEALLVNSEKTITRRGLPEETVTCSITGKRLLRDEAGQSEASGRMGDKDLLLLSPRLKKKVFADDLIACPLSGLRLLPEEMEASDVSARRVAPECLKRSTISNRRGTPDELGTCEFTGAKCLTDELSKSEISGRQYRSDQQAIGDDGRRGHKLEFRECAHSHRLLLPSQGDVSSISGLWAATEYLVSSDITPQRRGLPSESVRCAVTGKLLLVDEAGTSEISGRRGDSRLLVQSPLGRKWGFTEEMTQCPESRLWFCTEELEECSITGLKVDPRLLGRSDVSGKCSLKRTMKTCALSGRVALPSEVGSCDLTGSSVLTQYLGTCVVTGKTVLRKLLVACDSPAGLVIDEDAYRSRSGKSGRICAARLAKQCSWTGKVLLPDEGAMCNLTQLWFDVDHLLENEFRLLRQLLGHSAANRAMSDCPHLIPWLNTLIHRSGMTIRMARGMLSPDGQRSLIAAEIARWPWQPERWMMLLAGAKERKVIGQAVVFKAQSGQWSHAGLGEATDSSPS